MKTNKVEIKIVLTNEQKKDFLRAIEAIKKEGAKDDGRACQLLAIEYFSGIKEI